MWKTQVILALLVSITTDVATRSDDLSLETYMNDRLSGIGTRVAQVFVEDAFPRVSYEDCASQPGICDGQSVVGSKLA